jgi:hypothetical protein
VKKWEKEEQEFLTLQADMLQLKNALYRQRRIRLLNEKTNTTSSERCDRAEALVAEMRADLKSLKHRLDEELSELGVNEEASQKILSRFYRAQNGEGSTGEASPLKVRIRFGILGRICFASFLRLVFFKL